MYVCVPVRGRRRMMGEIVEQVCVCAFDERDERRAGWVCFVAVFYCGYFYATGLANEDDYW